MPNRIVVTGGLGFLGQYLVRDILISFPESKVKILDLKDNPDKVIQFGSKERLEIKLGKDICKYNSIKKEIKKSDIVVHLAGMVSFWKGDKERLFSVNCTGTKNIARICLENHANLLVHVGSVAAVGYNDDKYSPIDETFRHNWKDAEIKEKYYMLSKHLGVEEVLKGIKHGLNAIIVHPGLLYGPGDIANSSRLIKAIKDKRIPFNMPGGTNIVDVRDVSKGIVRCIKKGKKGESYLLSGHNITFRQQNKVIAGLLGVNPPRFTIPRCMNSLFYAVFSLIENDKKKPELSADSLDSSFKFRYFNNSKAGKELCWKPEIGFEKTIKDTISWMERNDKFNQ